MTELEKQNRWTLYVCSACRMVRLTAIEPHGTGVCRGMYVAIEVVPASQAEQLAKDILSLADDAGMPDTYKVTDQRMIRARALLP